MNLRPIFRKALSFIKGIEEQDYENCDKLARITGISWKPEHVHVGYSDTNSARYIPVADGGTAPSALCIEINKALSGNAHYKKMLPDRVCIMRDEFTALKI